MSVKIRLTRTGKSQQVTYRIVAQDTHSKRDGKFLEILGFYNPSAEPSLEINKEKLAAWTKKGAKPTLAVENLLNEGKLNKKVSKRKLARDAAKAKTTADKAEAQKQAAEAPAPAPAADQAQSTEEPAAETQAPEPQAEASSPAETSAPTPEVAAQATEQKAPEQESAA
ncbi:MAG TPA: 30S ribosomal protein S16 [Candidatus Saccharimonadales bacterium]|nr:30S ribosomal protein S16 [Candidatus Saccharimonadales bacterium]